MIGDFFRAIGQLSDPRFRSVLFRGLGLTVALLLIHEALVHVTGKGDRGSTRDGTPAGGRR